MVHVLEGTSVNIATEAAEAIAKSMGIDTRKGFSYLMSHGKLDISHVDFFIQLVNKIEDKAIQDQIIKTAKMIYYLWGNMFDEVQFKFDQQIRLAANEKFIFLVVLLLPNILFAAEAPHVLLQREWDKSMYVLTGSEQKKAMIALSKQAESLMKQHKNDGISLCLGRYYFKYRSRLIQNQCHQSVGQGKRGKSCF